MLIDHFRSFVCKPISIIFDSLLFHEMFYARRSVHILHHTLHRLILSLSRAYKSDPLSQNTKHLLAQKAFSSKTGFIRLYPQVTDIWRFLYNLILFLLLTYLALVQIDITSTHFAVNLVSGPQLNWVSHFLLTTNKAILYFSLTFFKQNLQKSHLHADIFGPTLCIFLDKHLSWK